MAAIEVIRVLTGECVEGSNYCNDEIDGRDYGATSEWWQMWLPVDTIGAPRPRGKNGAEFPGWPGGLRQDMKMTSPKRFAGSWA